MKTNKIFITGIGSISSLGYENEEVYNNLKNNQNNIRVKSDWGNEKMKPTLFGAAKDIVFKDEIKWKERLLPNKYSQLGILACKNAIEDANLNLKEQDNEVGLIIETCLAATESVEDYLNDLYQKGVARVRPLKFTKTVANTVLGDISRHFKLNGQSSLLYNENSISYGFDLIQKGVADIVICGGVDHFTEFRILSEQENNLLLDTSQVKSLSNKLKSAQFPEKNLLGEGAAFIVLESEKSVKKRQAKIYAEILDYHSNFDFENVDYSYKRQPYILSNACNRFKKHIDSDKKITFMSAYTTQVQSDLSEALSINELNKDNPVNVINHKAYTGDMKAASNIMGLCISSQLLKKDKEYSSNYAFISNSHEGGTSSHFLLKQNSNY
jgi:3-oxoacyl-(acyl-carrier-protein) synthase